MELGKNYACEGQLSIFDVFEMIPQNIRFAPVIDELSEELNSMLTNIRSETYDVWEHVKNLGFRYTCWAKLTHEEYDMLVKRSNLAEKYKEKELELSISLIPALEPGFVDIMISTLWENKKRRKKG